MALHGGQKKFDKNEDGKLSAGEWQSWYFATYGVDMEREEQRKKAQETALWNDRLGQMMDAARSSAERVVRAAQRLLPDRADAKELAWKAMLCQITAALKEGEEWKIAWRTHVGQMVSNSVVYPVQAVTRDLMEVSGLFAPKEAGRMALPCRVLFQEVGDWVKVPYGMENVVKRGKVTSVTRCTRRTAPWPPEETKIVLCMTEQPTEFEVQ